MRKSANWRSRALIPILYKLRASRRTTQSITRIPTAISAGPHGKWSERCRWAGFPVKTIIFARNHNLALSTEEAVRRHAAGICLGASAKSSTTTIPAPEQLIDHFKGLDESTNKELTIAISADMLDTGIDVPEIGLVFAKPVKSK